MNHLLLTATAIVALVAGILVALGTVLGRMLVQWNWPVLTDVHKISEKTVVLDSNPLTRFAGVYGLRTRTGHARVGSVIADDGKRVTRAVEAVHGDILSARRAAFDGDFHALPQEVGEVSDIVIPTPVGPAPAWLFEGAASDLWIIHVHGFLADRNNVLRTVAALQGLPATQLVVSYRGDGEGPQVVGNATRLGLDEWEDVDAALRYARDHGAEQIIMVGWSMGAAISLLIGERSALRSLIIGQVFVSPATDWVATMQTSAQRMRIPFPQALARYAAWFLRNPLLSRLTGLGAPIDFAELNWTKPGRVHVPTLAIHSTGDLTIPITATRRFVNGNAKLASLHEATRAPHTWEFNVDVDGIGSVARSWVSSLLQRTSAPAGPHTPGK